MQVPAYVSLRVIAGCYLQPAFPGARPLIRWSRFPAVHLTSPPGGARSAGTSPCWPEPPRGQLPPTYPRRPSPLQGQRSWFILLDAASLSPRPARLARWPVRFVTQLAWATGSGAKGGLLASGGQGTPGQAATSQRPGGHSLARALRAIVRRRRRATRRTCVSGAWHRIVRLPHSRWVIGPGPGLRALPPLCAPVPGLLDRRSAYPDRCSVRLGRWQ
jgi:hypothetical protein